MNLSATWHYFKHYWLKQYPAQYPEPVQQAWRRVKSQRLTYLSHARLESLLRQCLRIEQLGINGQLIETGCALGGSAILMCAAKTTSRPLMVYDLFGTIPPPSTADGEDAQQRYTVIHNGDASGIAGDVYYGYQPDLQAKVAHNFATLGYPITTNHVTLKAGLIQNTLSDDSPVALAHLDVDWFDTVDYCLKQIAPRLQTNGALIIDDYFDWSGCKKAVDQFLIETKMSFKSETDAGHLVLIKQD